MCVKIGYDYKPLRMACDEHRFGRVKAMKAIEVSMSNYSSTSLKDESYNTNPILNIVEAIIYSAIYAQIISRQLYSSMIHAFAEAKSKRTKYRHIN